MPEEVEPVASDGAPSGGNGLRNVLLAIAVIYVVISLYVMFDMRGRVEKLEQRATHAEAAEAELVSKISGARSESKSETGALAAELGVTQKQITARAATLQRQQQEAESRLAEQQKEQKQLVTDVSGQVAGVKTEVGAVKTDVAATRVDLEATRAKLERAIGDLGIQSGLIATTRGELDILKHKGDRNYYEFTLGKSKGPTPVGTVSLQLKKTDPKKGKYTLNVLADDRTIEKKDRNLNEPIQFYSGRERQLFELVVFTIDKDKVSGYVSAPKNAPAPVESK